MESPKRRTRSIRRSRDPPTLPESLTVRRKLGCATDQSPLHRSASVLDFDDWFSGSKILVFGIKD
jgi:hypothetical protein